MPFSRKSKYTLVRSTRSSVNVRSKEAFTCPNRGVFYFYLTLVEPLDVSGESVWLICSRSLSRASGDKAQGNGRIMCPSQLLVCMCHRATIKRLPYKNSAIKAHKSSIEGGVAAFPGKLLDWSYFHLYLPVSSHAKHGPNSHSLE